MELYQLRKDKALLDGEIADISKVISSLKGNLTHRSVRFELKVARCKLTGERHKLIQRIKKLETEHDLLAALNACTLDDEARDRLLKTMARLQGIKTS